MPKTIVTAAITGAIHTPSMSPHLPITPGQIADHAVGAWEAGAAVVHIHARDPETGQPTSDAAVFGEIFERIRSRCDVIICATTGGGLGMSIEERTRVVHDFRLELASFNAGSINFGLFDLPERMKIQQWHYDWELPYLRMTKDFIFRNTFKSLEELPQMFSTHGTKPEAEVYDSGMLNNLAYLVDRGYLQKPVYVQFVLGIMGALPASVENLLFLLQLARRTLGLDFIWSVCAAGRFQMPLCTAGLLLGGNVRVGMEDSLWLEKGVPAKSSAEQVAKIARIARELSIETATPAEARQILGLHASRH
ncbi:MAG: 3-keto-5-aminohexanoate cleavage protein [Chloroflexota bacterium]